MVCCSGRISQYSTRWVFPGRSFRTWILRRRRTKGVIIVLARVMRCWERRAAEAPAEEVGLSLKILFRASEFLAKTVGRMKDRREMSSVKLFCRGYKSQCGT